MQLNQAQQTLQQVVRSGEKFLLQNMDTGYDCVAVIRTGGKSGGAKHNLYAAWAGDENDVTENMATVRISQLEADDLGVSL